MLAALTTLAPKKWMLATGGVVLLLIVVYMAGVSRERRSWEERQLRDYRETRSMIDEATSGLDTDDAVDKRLRELVQ